MIEALILVMLVYIALILSLIHKTQCEKQNIALKVIIDDNEEDLE